MKRILLVEPNYKNKYPPMGLMKISSYHKILGDDVHFVKGINNEAAQQVWDRIYVTSLFTFDFHICIETIKYYMRVVDNIRDIYCGGIMASLMPTKVSEATGLPLSQILTGLFTDTSVVGDCNDINIDQLPLDYDILEEIDYQYPAGDNYFGYTTRGCPNHCNFCAVPILEPEFQVTNNIVQQIKEIDEKYGPKQHLLLLDNNVLNTPNLESLVDDLCSIGFGKNAKYIDPGVYHIVMMRYHRGERFDFLDRKLKSYLQQFKKRIKSKDVLETYISILIEAEEADDFAQYMLDKESILSPIIEKYKNRSKKSRYLDFNQGIDGRKINDTNMEQLARLSIRPLRIAFDDIRLEDIYRKAVRTAHRHGIKEISNYILYNYKDKPFDLYRRLQINIELNEELGIKIFSFPMKYSPITLTNRNYIGEKWEKKQILAISAILQVTKGVVAAGTDFFYKAFGNNPDEYDMLLAMPRDMIMFRNHFENEGITDRWIFEYKRLDENQRKRLLKITSLSTNELKEIEWPKDLKCILPFYLIKYRGSVDNVSDIHTKQKGLLDDADDVYDDYYI